MKSVVFLSLFFLLSIFLAETYQQVGNGKIIGVASVNSVFAAIVLIFGLRQGREEQEKSCPFWIWIPHIGICLFIVILITISSFFGEPQASVPYPHSIFAVILWVPLVEEIVFRCGIGRLFRHAWTGWVGLYISALFFALAHSMPTLERVLSEFPGAFSIPAPPFLLGLACEVIYKYSGRLYPAILLHSICNGSGVIFSQVDPRILSWFSWFYI